MRAAWLLLLACACGEGQQPSTEASGPPRRIVSLLPSLTQIVVELGAGDRLVGCTEACEPGRELTRVSWREVAAVEPILRLRPDLVLRQEVRAERDALRRALESVGVRLLVVPSETVADIRGGMLEVGRALALEGRAAALAERFERELEEARRPAVGKQRPTVLLVFGRDAGAVANVSAAGPGTFLSEMLDLAGGRNVLHDMTAPYPSLTLEEIVRRSPTVIIDILPPEKTAADARRAWEPLREALGAVRAGRVYPVMDRSVLIPGPGLPESVSRLVEMIHG